MTLIAADLLLLRLDDAKGTVSTWGKTDAVLGGAVQGRARGVRGSGGRAPWRQAGSKAVIS